MSSKVTIVKKGVGARFHPTTPLGLNRTEILTALQR